jgi:hypothetical protein
MPSRPPPAMRGTTQASRASAWRQGVRFRHLMLPDQRRGWRGFPAGGPPQTLFATLPPPSKRRRRALRAAQRHFGLAFRVLYRWIPMCKISLS